MATSLFLVRHGDTAHNYHGDPKRDKVKGTRVDLPLDESGRKAAEEAGAVLKKEGITHVISSPLKRGVETAQIIAKATGAQAAVSSRLLPWDVGAFSGKPYYNVQKLMRYHQENPDQPVPYGESYGQFHDRWAKALPELLDFARENKGKVAVVVHSRHLLALDSALKGQEPKSNKVFGTHAPGSVLRLDVEASATEPR